jgi:hypothetical protein
MWVSPKADSRIGLPAGEQILMDDTRRRATLCELTKEARKELRDVFYAAILSDDPEEMTAVAARLKKQGAIHSARILYEAASSMPKRGEAS